MNDLLQGATAGCVATIPMTVAMEVMHRRLPDEEQYPLPPRTVAMRVAEEAGVEEDLDEDEKRRFYRVTSAGTTPQLMRSWHSPPPPL